MPLMPGGRIAFARASIEPTSAETTSTARQSRLESGSMINAFVKRPIQRLTDEMFQQRVVILRSGRGGAH